MATIENLYQFEDQLESAIAGVLAANGITVFTQREDPMLAAPFVSIQVRVGEVQGYQAFSESVVRPVAWKITIVFRVTTNRHADTTNHVTWRSVIRHLMYGYQATFNSAVLSLHELGEMTEAGTSAMVIPENDFDVSEITFNSCFAVREAYRSLLAT